MGGAMGVNSRAVVRGGFGAVAGDGVGCGFVLGAVWRRGSLLDGDAGAGLAGVAGRLGLVGSDLRSAGCGAAVRARVGAVVATGSVLRASDVRRSSSRRAAASCSSVNSMLVPQRQQSATISQSRIVIGAPHSGQAQARTSPLSHSPASRSNLAPGEDTGEVTGGNPPAIESPPEPSVIARGAISIPAAGRSSIGRSAITPPEREGRDESRCKSGARQRKSPFARRGYGLRCESLG
jgi:hypothetical protein